MLKNLFKALAVIIFLTVTPIERNLITARAEPAYHRVLTDVATFYSSPNENSAMFYLPYSYYVKRIGYSGEFCHVECYGYGSTPLIDGYVKISDLSDPCDTAYPYLSYSITTTQATEMYFNPDFDDTFKYVFKDRTLNYYGKYVSKSGKVFYCVSYNKSIGYVAEDSVFPFTIPLNPDPIETETAAKADDAPLDNDDKSESLLKTGVIVAIALSAVIIIFLIVLPEKRAKNDYSEND